MGRALVSNCNDLLRARRMRRLTQCFPEVRGVFRKFGQYSLLVH
jgi:hypothetical protein